MTIEHEDAALEATPKAQKITVAHIERLLHPKKLTSANYHAEEQTRDSGFEIPSSETEDDSR